jgi:hypothetical protein
VIDRGDREQSERPEVISRDAGFNNTHRGFSDSGFENTHRGFSAAGCIISSGFSVGNPSVYRTYGT